MGSAVVAALGRAATVLLCGALAGCGADGDEGSATAVRRDGAGRRPAAALAARPASPTQERPGPGEVRLDPVPGTGGVVHVPAGIEGPSAVPLVVMFHGAGGRGDQALAIARPLADELGFVVVAPDSVAGTWDVIAGGWGPDVERVDRALRWVFDRVAVDPERIVAAGFSDGASYALSLGLANGSLFSHVVAFSPGFAAPPRREGAPAIFVSHGTDDPVLPIARTSRRLVPPLEDAGYDLRYVEFTGGHEVPADVLEAGFRPLAG